MFFKNQGKTYIDEDGYLRFKDSDKLVHRWVVEKELGHPLPKGSIVHHINGDKLDNRIENLKVFASQENHESEHIKLERRSALLKITSGLLKFFLRL